MIQTLGLQAHLCLGWQSFNEMNTTLKSGKLPKSSHNEYTSKEDSLQIIIVPSECYLDDLHFIFGVFAIPEGD